jgi:methionyl aminopeptidase
MSDSSTSVELKSSEEIKRIQRGGRILGRILRQVSSIVAPGVTTRELDRMARELIEQAGARPAFLGYHNFPNTLCTSINEEVVHGIPSRRTLEPGDIISLDCGLFLDGFFVDAAVTIPVGPVELRVRRLIETTRRALEAAIAECRAGKRLGDVGAAIQECVEHSGFNVVREYTGHGIGRQLHEPPKILNYGKRETGTRIQTGMVLALEPMVNMGTWRTDVRDDNWTVVTADGCWSAHFEHTIAVTPEGPQILTQEVAA